MAEQSKNFSIIAQAVLVGSIALFFGAEYASQIFGGLPSFMVTTLKLIAGVLFVMAVFILIALTRPRN
jgi:threonine/homoserine efflux transporter RhtA